MKSVNLYKLDQVVVQEILSNLLTEEVLAQNAFVPCGNYDSRRLGFSLNLDDTFASDQKVGTLLKITEQLKKPEAYAVDSRLKLREAQHKADTGQSVKKAELSKWKAEITESLLPETHPKEPKTFSLLIRKDGLVLVEGTSKLAEDMISLVRKALGSFPATAIETNVPVGDLLDFLVKPVDPNQTLKARQEETLVKIPEDDKFSLGQKVSIVTGEERKMNLTAGDVYGSELADLVVEGSYVTKLELTRDGAVMFTLKDDLTLAGVKFSNDIFDDGNTEAEDDEKAKASTDELLMLEELCLVVDDILGRLEGEV